MNRLLAILVSCVAVGAAAGNLDTVTLAIEEVPLTTNTAATATSIPIAGHIKLIKIDVTADANMDLDLVTPLGVVVYSADDVTADALIAPVMPLYSNDGVAIESTGATTNGVWAPIPVLGVLTLTASDEATTNKNVTVTVLYERH